jgi:hypothetical protein
VGVGEEASASVRGTQGGWSEATYLFWFLVNVKEREGSHG